MPERAPPGQLPRSVDVLLENDLVDSCKPGDRVLLSGVYRALPSKANSSGMFRTIVVGNHVRHLTKGASIGTFTSEDVKNCKALAKRKECLRLLSESLAPSIFGHSQEKVALLLMLLGGKEKNLENGTHLRGDINILMLGAHALSPRRARLWAASRCPARRARPPACARRLCARRRLRPSPRLPTSPPLKRRSAEHKDGIASRKRTSEDVQRLEVCEAVQSSR